MDNVINQLNDQLAKATWHTDRSDLRTTTETPAVTSADLLEHYRRTGRMD